MQGKNFYTPQVFVYVNIEELVPANHLLRKIDKIFDLSFVRDLTSSYYCHDNGRPSIDPEIFFRMVLIGYIFNIKHDRKLCEEVTCNLAYSWYCKLNLNDKIPDHSSLSRIRDRYGEEVFEKFFSKVVEKCRDYGLLKGERVITDSTLVDADASLDSMIAKDAEIAKKEKQAVETRKPTDPMPKIKITNDTHVSKTDPDSSLAKKEGTPKGLRYKLHSTIDADSRVILDCNITTGALHDTKVYLDRIEYIQGKYRLNIKEAIADRAYGAIDNIKSLNAKDIITYIPLFSGRSGKSTLAMKEAGFIYDKDKYICPAGQKMLPGKEDKGTVPYYASARICKICTAYSVCPAIGNKKSRGVIHRNKDQELFERELSRMKESIFHKKLNERMWKIEGILSEAKNKHGLSRARYRGLSKVQIQSYMVSSVQNLKRLVVSLLEKYVLSIRLYGLDVLNLQAAVIKRFCNLSINNIV